MQREALIVAGGKGMRLRPYTTLIPKPLVPIGDRAIVEIVLEQLRDHGFTRAVISLGHLAPLIRAFVGDGSHWGIDVDYVEESSPLGTMGPVLLSLDHLPEHFIVVNGDLLTDIDYGDLLETHVRSGAPVTVATYEREHRIDFGVLDHDGRRITGFREKPTFTYSVSMGIYAVSTWAMRHYPTGVSFGFDDLILDLLERGERPACYPFDGFWLDIGRPEDYDRANEDFATLEPRLFPSHR